VRKGTVLEGADLFDAAFFGMSPREAQILDPQQRIFLECAWEAMEHAGYAGNTADQAVGVYAGVGMNTYFISQLLQNPAFLASAGGYQLMVGNDKDFLATRASYKLDLHGPSITVQTACSTSLVAVALACRALAAGMRPGAGRRRGRPLPAARRIPVRGRHDPLARRSLPALRRARARHARQRRRRRGRAQAALAGRSGRRHHPRRHPRHGHQQRRRGQAGYTAPSVEGQVEVIATAQAVANVAPRSIGYVEAHGTGTPLGDPIEIAALTQAFRASTRDVGFCRIGSLKANIGHLDAAAGVAASSRPCSCWRIGNSRRS